MTDVTTPAEWVTAIATSLAVIVALCVALSERWRQRRREERQQARAVHVWVDTRLEPPFSASWVIRLFNGSTRPVFKVELILRLKGRDGRSARGTLVRRDALLPGEADPWSPQNGIMMGWNESVDVRGRVEWKGRNDSTYTSPDGHSSWVIDQIEIVRVTFTDADGHRWAVKDGKLKRA